MEKSLSLRWSSAEPRLTSKLVRYDVRGSLDRSFGHGGTVAAGAALGMAVQQDGRIITTGRAMLRYTARGVLDPSFGHGGKIPSLFLAVAIQRDGKIVAVTSAGIVVRYTSRGTRDRTFRTAVVDMDYPHCHRADLRRQDRLAGQSGDWAAADFAVARLTPTGALDRTFGDGGKAVIDFTP